MDGKGLPLQDALLKYMMVADETVSVILSCSLGSNIKLTLVSATKVINCSCVIFKLFLTWFIVETSLKEMSHKPAVGKEDEQGGQGDECDLPLVGGLQADPDPADKPAGWLWCGLGLGERERQPEAPRAGLAKGNTDRPKGLVKLNQTCRDTPKFPRPSVRNMAKENVGKVQDIVNAKQTCVNSPRCPNPSKKRNKVCNMTLQDHPRIKNQVRKTTTQADRIKNLRDVRTNLPKQPRETSTTAAEKSSNVRKVEDAAVGTLHKGKVDGPPQPSPPKTGTTVTLRRRIFNSRVAVAVLLVLHMVVVQLFGYLWYSVAAMDD